MSHCGQLGLIIAENYVESVTAPVLPADYVSTGNARKNGVHCSV